MGESLNVNILHNKGSSSASAERLRVMTHKPKRRGQRMAGNWVVMKEADAKLSLTE